MRTYLKHPPGCSISGCPRLHYVVHCSGCGAEFHLRPGMLAPEAVRRFISAKKWTWGKKGKHLCPDCDGSA